MITLEVTLQNALATDETVVFTISDDSEDLGADFDGSVDAQRDVDYRAVVQSLSIPSRPDHGDDDDDCHPHQQQRRG